MITDKKHIPIFPISLFKFELDDFESLNKDLLKLIYKEFEKDPQGVDYSNYGGWHSESYLNHNYKFDLFTDKLIYIMNELLIPTFVPEKEPIVKNDIRNLWAGINKKNNFNFTHCHPNTWLSGVYYVKVEHGVDSGQICFRDPIVQRTFTSYKFNSRGEWLCNPVREGTLLIFPAYLEHKVFPNTLDSDRVVLSFNIQPKYEERIL